MKINLLKIGFAASLSLVGVSNSYAADQTFCGQCSVSKCQALPAYAQQCVASCRGLSGIYVQISKACINARPAGEHAALLAAGGFAAPVVVLAPPPPPPVVVQGQANNPNAPVPPPRPGAQGQVQGQANNPNAPVPPPRPGAQGQVQGQVNNPNAPVPPPLPGAGAPAVVPPAVVGGYNIQYGNIPPQGQVNNPNAPVPPPRPGVRRAYNVQLGNLPPQGQVQGQGNNPNAPVPRPLPQIPGAPGQVQGQVNNPNAPVPPAPPGAGVNRHAMQAQLGTNQGFNRNALNPPQGAPAVVPGAGAPPPVAGAPVAGVPPRPAVDPALAAALANRRRDIVGDDE